MPTRFFQMPPSAIKDDFLRTMANKMAPDAIKDDFLRTLTNKAIVPDKAKSTRLSRTTPISGENIHTAAQPPLLKGGQLTIDFATKISRQHSQDNAFGHPNVRLPCSASNDDHRGG